MLPCSLQPCGSLSTRLSFPPRCAQSPAVGGESRELGGSWVLVWPHRAGIEQRIPRLIPTLLCAAGQGCYPPVSKGKLRHEDVRPTHPDKGNKLTATLPGPGQVQAGLGVEGVPGWGVPGWLSSNAAPARMAAAVLLGTSLPGTVTQPLSLPASNFRLDTQDLCSCLLCFSTLIEILSNCTCHKLIQGSPRACDLSIRAEQPFLWL